MTSPFGGIPGDIAESKQDRRELNLWTLIGCTDERGDAWHRIQEFQGAEDNHYPGLIPIGDVMRRLFYWEPQKLQVAYLRPCEAVDADFIRADGMPVKVIETQSNRVGVIRSDTDRDLGVFRSGAEHPPYQVTLIREAERLTGQTLGISTAGLLEGGAKAWVEFSMPESLHDPKSGLSYRPNLVKADSMDGSMSLTTALTVTATVCLNTLRFNLAESKSAGRQTRRKHTRGIVSGNLDDERHALGLLELMGGEFEAGLHELIARPLSATQRIEVMDIIVPLPELPGRSRTLAESKRDRLQAMDTDPMVSQWVGTALGEVQRYSTFNHWYDNRRGGVGRWEGNVWRGLNGTSATSDTAVVEAIERVLCG